MKIYKTLQEVLRPNHPVVLSIGYFDGLHLGHQAVLKRVMQIAEERKGQSAVFTFSNHPSTILRPDHPIENLYSPDQKVHLIKEFGIDLIVVIPFDLEIAKQSADEFLQNVKKILPFSHLILGHDARIGFQRKGDPITVEEIGKKEGFAVEYLPPIKRNDMIVSSSLIRKYLASGDLKTAEILLGHKL